MTREEYEAKYQQNTKFTGFGLDTATVMPCPGCAEPDFVTLPVLTPAEALEKGAVCKACGRGFRAIVSREPGETQFEIVQTQGDDLPPFLMWMRRVAPAPSPPSAPALGWPDKPTCHHVDPVFKIADAIAWHPSGGDAHRPHRTCSYCGSAHPGDLVELLAKPGVTLGGADWKYGWPHKFYLNGEVNGVSLHGKFYNEHLLDDGYSPEAFTELVRLLELHAGIRFEIKYGKLGYAAPHRGYQR